MPVKRSKKTKAVRDGSAERASRKKPAEMTPEEVVTLELQAARHQQAERAWLRLTQLPEEDERWVRVEENLLDQPRQQEHAERRWKYFSK